MNNHKHWLTAIFVLFVAVCSPAQAQQAVDINALAAILKGGGHVIVFRHGATHRDQADTDPLNHENIAKQRQLNDGGRELARQIGETFRAQGIPLGKVYTSRFNRAFETGKLINNGEVATLIDITEGGLVVSPIENDRRAEAFRKLAGSAPESGKNTLVVSHKPNIIDAFGKDWFDVKEGEASIFKPDSSGKAALVGRVQAVDWLKLKN